MFKKSLDVRWWSLLLVIFAVASCENNPAGRKYQEVVIAPDSDSAAAPSSDPGSIMPPMDALDEQTQAMLMDSVAQVPLSWETPKDWQESKGQGMRLVSFVTNDLDPIEGSIVSLGGMAGGIEANVSRWMQQINLTGIASKEFDAFVSTPEQLTTQGGFKMSIFDFTQLQSPDDPKAPSMLAAIVIINGKTVFIKMTGSQAAVFKNREKFKDLCRSLKTQ